MIRNLFIMLLLSQVICSQVVASSIGYSKVKFGHILGHVVTIDLTNPEVKVTVALARGGTGKSETFKSIVKRTNPAAAITGTFFDTKTYIPTGDIAMFGTLVHSGCIGSALCIDYTNKASIVPMNTGRKYDWSGYETVLCAGPVLISKGAISISLKKEGFRGSLCAPNTRTAAGITRNGKLLFVAVNRKVSLHAIAGLMIKLGVVDAVSLDGGSSTAFYSGGRYIAVPSRRLTNLLVAYSSSVNYQKAKTALAPARLFPKPTEQPIEQPVQPIVMQDLNALTAYAFPVADEIRQSAELHQ